MSKNIQAIRGMKDYLPEELALWQYVEGIIKSILNNYGYNEIRLPIVEQTMLFRQAIGKVNDVIEKEMYSFIDRNGKSLTLRPEGTASCVRAGIERGLLSNQEQRFWYIGPMFRYERPQKGRYRQFHQIGAEVFGQQGPNVDAELILLTTRCWRRLGIINYLTLELNSIGSLESRTAYCNALVNFLVQNEKFLDKDCRRRMYTNPMRILDTKNLSIQILLNDAPIITNYLDDDSLTHFTNLCNLLDLSGIKYKVNPRLVRGLDYYNWTVFEWVTTYLGSQGTICGGGRYDGLVEQLGGKPTLAAGFAIGLERLVLLLRSLNIHFVNKPCIDIYLTSTQNNSAQYETLQLAEKLRDEIPSIRIITNYNSGNFKKHLARADKYGARIILLVNENKKVPKQIIIKDLVTGNQEIIAQNDIASRLVSILK